MATAANRHLGSGRVTRTARDLWILLREEGPRSPLAELREILGRWIYGRSDQTVVRKELVVSDAPSSALRIEPAEPRHLPLLAEFNRRQHNTRRTQRFATALEEGARALLGFRDGELIGYFWWQEPSQPPERVYMTRFGLTLAEDEVYGFDLYIAPELRGQGVPGEFLAGVESKLARLGYRYMYGTVDNDNVPARWLYATRGYEEVRRCRTRTFLRRLLVINGKPWLSGPGGLRPLKVAGGRR